MTEQREFDQSVWKTLLKTTLSEEGDEISCGECFTLLDLYAEILSNGGDPVEVIPKAKQHLKMCQHCNSELQAMINSMAEGK